MRPTVVVLGIRGCSGCGVPAPDTASAVCSTLGCAWTCLRHAPVGSGGGMVLFGLGRGWAQSHESATPTVGGHADTELAVTRPRPPVTWPRAERGSGSRR